MFLFTYLIRNLVEFQTLSMIYYFVFFKASINIYRASVMEIFSYLEKDGFGITSLIASTFNVQIAQLKVSFIEDKLTNFPAQ